MNTHTILPEEVLHEILQLCFRERTLEDIFTGYHPPHYLEDPRGIPTQLLLVCKQWLRVATPLLYETVQLRSNADVVKLARTLTSTPSLGPLIHNLYLNGGYGHKLHDVIRHAPNICTLYVELHLLSKLPISGLLHALPRMNPTQVFVHGYDWGNVNKKTSTITRAFFDALGRWKSLKLLTFVGMLSAEETLLPRVLEAIEKAPALPEIGFEQYTLEQLLSQPKFCSAVSHGTGLKRIQCYGTEGALEWDKECWRNVPEEIKEHIVYEETRFYAMKAKWLDGFELCID